MPSFPNICRAYVREDIASYNKMIIRTNKVISEFGALSTDDKKEALKKWIALIEVKHRAWEDKHYVPPMTPSDDFQSSDISKIDILLVSMNWRTLFHQRRYLDLVYNTADSKDNLRFEPKVAVQWTEKIATQVNAARRTDDLALYSFQWPLDKISHWTIKWIKDGVNLKSLNELDINKLYSK